MIYTRTTTIVQMVLAALCIALVLLSCSMAIEGELGRPKPRAESPCPSAEP